MSETSIEQEWENYFNTIFEHPAIVPKKQHDEMKRAFMAGALCVVMPQDDMTDSDYVLLVRQIRKDVVKFFFDDINRRMAELN